MRQRSAPHIRPTAGRIREESSGSSVPPRSCAKSSAGVILLSIFAPSEGLKAYSLLVLLSIDSLL